ncbi:MAG: alpha/beta hydrolase [Gemmatimonadales bacterium]|nr:alpha/beta hydrolase [Gemmatimonadales bacterium]
MKPSHRLLLLFSVAAVSACSPRRAAELFLLGSHFDAVQHLPYGAGPRQRLDVYSPRDAGGKAAPVVVFLYGGRWQEGSKEEYRLVGDALTGRGFVAVVPDYRLYPEVRFPAWVDDAASALRWVRDSIQRFGGDPTRIVVVGHSAGAHTAALLALDEGYLRRAGLPAEAVRGFVSIAGPVATEWTDRDVQALMGPREGWPATYPMRHVEGTEPPMLLLHGGRDETVSPANSVRLAELIRERGGCAREIVYEGLGHVSIAVALAVPGLGLAPVLEEVAAFARLPTGICGE